MRYRTNPSMVYTARVSSFSLLLRISTTCACYYCSCLSLLRRLLHLLFHVPRVRARPLLVGLDAVLFVHGSQRIRVVEARNEPGGHRVRVGVHLRLRHGIVAEMRRIDFVRSFLNNCTVSATSAESQEVTYPPIPEWVAKHSVVLFQQKSSHHFTIVDCRARSLSMVALLVVVRLKIRVATAGPAACRFVARSVGIRIGARSASPYPVLASASTSYSRLRAAPV